ncbi:FliI/YscN family ATPase [Trinickia mobilis]
MRLRPDPATRRGVASAGAAETAAIRAAGEAWRDACIRRLATLPLATPRGRLLQVRGTLLAARVPNVCIGELCLLSDPSGGVHELMAEVVGFSEHDVLLSPLGPMDGLSPATEVVALRRAHAVQCGDWMFGRLFDGFGRPLDGGPAGPGEPLSEPRPVVADAPSPSARPRIVDPLPTGVRALDAFVTLGRGQRVGLFAAAGCGKTTLLAALARGVAADAIVFALVGERGREVREFLERELDPALAARATVVCATSDRPAIERVRAAQTATAIAEHVAAQGGHALLLVDSLTRFARAQREIGLAAGEPPARLGFPPSVYAMLPRLIERAGNRETGAITAVYTVLTESDDAPDPLAEEIRSLLDGHIVLSRKLAEAGRFPAVDVLASLSRVARALIDDAHAQSASALRASLAKHAELELLIELGEYRPGENADADRAIALHPHIVEFLRQNTERPSPWRDTLEALHDVLSLA